MEHPVLLSGEAVNLPVALSGYRLIPGYVGRLSLPVELQLNLYAVKDQEVVPIRSPEDLSPLIECVPDANAAWSILRLFSATETHYLFQRDIYTLDLQVCSSGAARSTAEISPEVAARVGYEAPTMRIHGEAYHALRDVIQAEARGASGRGPVILRRRESLSKRGEYRFFEDTVKGYVTASDVFLPCYE